MQFLTQIHKQRRDPKTDLEEVLANILASINGTDVEIVGQASTTPSSPATITTPLPASNSTQLWTVVLDIDLPFSPAEFAYLVS